MLNLFKVASYSGKDSYKYVENLICSGKRILIVSPYIDLHYANFILRNSSGKKYYILSSSMDARAKSLLLGGRFPKETVTLSVMFFLGFVLFLAINLYTYSAYMLVMSVLAIFATLLLLKRRNTCISVKLPKEFVHAKIYVSEGMAIHGSANLTYKGMHQNVEHIEVTREREAVDGLERQFWQLWKSS